MRIIEKNTWKKYITGDFKWKLCVKDGDVGDIEYLFAEEEMDDGQNKRFFITVTFEKMLYLNVKLRLDHYIPRGNRGHKRTRSEIVDQIDFFTPKYFKLNRIFKNLKKDEERRDYLHKRKLTINKLPKSIKREIQIDNLLEDEGD